MDISTFLFLHGIYATNIVVRALQYQLLLNNSTKFRFYRADDVLYLGRRRDLRLLDQFFIECL